MVMYAGRVREYGSTREIFGAPQDPYTWGLLNAMPTVERRLSRLVPIEGSPPSLIRPPPGCPFHPRCAFRFERCFTEVPRLRAPVKGSHLDACHLPWDRKRDQWRDLSAPVLDPGAGEQAKASAGS
jgi:peptide/nickel transport system ATP-binding protein